MPMRISPTIDTDPGRITTMFPRMSPIANSLSPATQSDILEILQREQDHAVALLSSSPLLTSLFVSYANQAAALESVTPSTESEEWKALENTISSLREEIEKLKPENVEMEERLKAAAASQEAFRSQVLGLKETNTIQQDEIKTLRTELLEAGGKFDRLLMSSNEERVTLQAQISNLEEERAELKGAVVEQQMKIWRLERKDSGSSPKTAPPDDRKLEGLNGRAMSGSGTDFPPQSLPAIGLSPQTQLHRRGSSLSIPPTLQELEAEDKTPAIFKPQLARSPIPFFHRLHNPPAPATPESRNSPLREDAEITPVIAVPGTSFPHASQDTPTGGSKEPTPESAVVGERKLTITDIGLDQTESQPGRPTATPSTVTSSRKKKGKGGVIVRSVGSMPPSSIVSTATSSRQLPEENETPPTMPPFPTTTLSTHEGDTPPTLYAPTYPAFPYNIGPRLCGDAPAAGV